MLLVNIGFVKPNINQVLLSLFTKLVNCTFAQCGSKKSRIRETKHLSTATDSSTNAIGGQTKNTPKPDFFEKLKKSSKTEKLKKRLEICQICDTLFDQRSVIHREAWFPGGPRTPKNPIFLRNGKNHPKRKNSKTSKDMPKLAIRSLTRGL